MSQEARIIKPFDGLEGFVDALTEPTMRFGSDIVVHANSVQTADLDAHEFLLRPVEIVWSDSDEKKEAFRLRLLSSCNDAGVDPGETSLIVTAQSRYLKTTTVVADQGLTELSDLDRVTRLDKQLAANALLSHHRGFVVDIQVVLTRGRVAEPLKPWRLGTVLSRSRYVLETSAGSALFRPTALTDTDRKRLSLPRRTMRYVDMGDHDPTRPSADQEEPVFYVDGDLLAELVAGGRSPAGTAIQMQLVQDFVTTIIHDASKKDLNNVTVDDLTDSLLDRVLRVLAGSSQKEEKARMLDNVRNRPGLAIAHAEDVLGISAAMREAVKGRDT